MPCARGSLSGCCVLDGGAGRGGVCGRPVLTCAHVVTRRRVGCSGIRRRPARDGGVDTGGFPLLGDPEGRRCGVAGERVRRVMLALVRSREGAAQATRRVVGRDRFARDWDVVEELARRRLLMIDDR
jgi:hypothetical protein